MLNSTAAFGQKQTLLYSAMQDSGNDHRNQSFPPKAIRMRKTALGLCIVATGFMFSAKAVELTDADWLSAAKVALNQFKSNETQTYVSTAAWRHKHEML